MGKIGTSRKFGASIVVMPRLGQSPQSGVNTIGPGKRPIGCAQPGLWSLQHLKVLQRSAIGAWNRDYRTPTGFSGRKTGFWPIIWILRI